MLFRALRIAATCGVFALCLTSAGAGTAVLQPLKDNTLYEDASGFLSNGAGRYLFSGLTAAAESRRAVVKFDVAAVIPAGATVTGARLTMIMNRAFPGEVSAPIDLHALDTDWGEAASDAPGEEGGGTAADRNDATWLHTFNDNAFWSSPGGDFSASQSATTIVDPALGPYSWGGPGLAADVQSWLDLPATNFGWILVGDETMFGTAKRFASREDPFIPNRPRLVVDFEVAGIGSSRVPEQTADGAPLRLEQIGGGDLQLTWGASCRASDVDYAVYEGVLGSFASHLPVVCSTGGASATTLTPSQDHGYFLVVPVGSGIEGSYGHATGGVERPLGIGACHAQVVIPCP